MFTKHVSSCNKWTLLNSSSKIFLLLPKSRKKIAVLIFLSSIFTVSSKNLYCGPTHNQKRTVSNPVPICSLILETWTLSAEVQKQGLESLNEKISCGANEAIRPVKCPQCKLEDWSLIHRAHILKKQILQNGSVFLYYPRAGEAETCRSLQPGGQPA